MTITIDEDTSDLEGVEVLMATLYLLEQYSVVKLEDEALRVQFPNDREHKQPGKVVRVPLNKIEQVVVLGDITLTTPALQTLLERRIAVHYLSAYGKSYGTLTADPAKNAGLRLAQYALAQDDARRFATARQCVAGKLLNMRTTLLRYARTRDNRAPFDAAARQLRACLHELQQLEAPTSNEGRMHGLGPLLGLEGSGSAAYYAAFGGLLKQGWQFNGRVKRPPTDPVNALLSFGYTVLTNQLVSLICTVGLDPGLGVLHQAGFGKPALALDLVEEFRPLVVDSVVVTMLNTGQIKPGDFDEELGAYRLRDEPRREFLTKLEARLNETVQHPLFGYKVTYRRCMELQARLFAKAALGEIAQYVPFTVR